MSRGLNSEFRCDVDLFLQKHSFTTVFLTSMHCAPRAGISYQFDFLESERGDASTVLYHAPSGITATDQLLVAYWLPQGQYIDVPLKNPCANYIFTPELSGCKIYVDRVSGDMARFFHIQGPHEAKEYTSSVQGSQLLAIDSNDYGIEWRDNPDYVNSIRANVVFQYGNNEWICWLQGLTNLGPGITGCGQVGSGITELQMIYPPGPPPGVQNVVCKKMGVQRLSRGG